MVGSAKFYQEKYFSSVPPTAINNDQSLTFNWIVRVAISNNVKFSEFLSKQNISVQMICSRFDSPLTINVHVLRMLLYSFVYFSVIANFFVISLP